MKKENEEIIEDILKERIEKNQELFNKKEIKVINNNFNTICKMYMLGLKDKNS